ncbi:MAG: YbhB/YbcL family Raf kinase inhibitor-like protein [Chitinophagales bacterium]
MITIATLMILLHFSEAEIRPLSVTSEAFKNNGKIPREYSCQGKEVNPPLAISNIPGEAKSLVLIVEDPDAPKGVFDHWVMWNIPNGSIAENSAPGVEGSNSAGSKKYKGPCPPNGKHRYFFKVYAIDILLDLPAGSAKMTVLESIKGHIVAQGELVGTYEN